MKELKVSLAVILLFSLLISGCKGKSEEKKSYTQIAKGYLEKGSYDLAAQYYDKALKENPENGEALTGSAISHFLSLTLDFADYLASVSGINRSKGIPHGSFDIMGTRTEKEDILEVAKKIMSGFLVRWEEMDRLLDIAKERGGDLRIKTLPVLWNMQKVMELGGKIDRTDIYFLSILSKIFLSTVKFILSQELDLDIYGIYTQYVHLKDKRINGEPVPTPLILMNIIVQQLNDPELKFLHLSEWDLDQDGTPDGKEFYTYPLTGLTEAYKDLMKLIETGLAEPLSDDQVVIVLDQKRGEEFSKITGDQNFKNMFTSIKYDVVLYNRLYVNNTTASVNLFLDENGISALKRIYSHLTTHTPERLSLNGDIFPVLADIVSSLLDFVAKTKIVELPDMVKKFLSIGTLYPGTIYGLLTGFIPDVINLDLRTFFANPVSFRVLLPPWRKDPYNSDENLFFLEWDTTVPYEPGVLSQYPLNGPYGIILPKDIPPEDVDHFTAGVYHEELYRGYGIKRILKDTLATPLPYISFRNNNASFNGLLYLDFANDKKAINDILNLEDYYGTTDYPDEFSPATARDFNALIGYFYEKFNLGNYIYR